MNQRSGAELLVKCLEQQGVEYIFGIPGAKIDRVFDALLDSNIHLVLCRHEQNAAFMAAAYGRMTGKPGVVLVTSGPGITNLVTGLLTATTEGDPVVALGGNVSLAMGWKPSHQSLNNTKLMEPVTKSSVEARIVSNIPELVANAFHLAQAPTRGACFISFPQDILNETTTCLPLSNHSPEATYGCSPAHLITQAADCINQAKQPVILLGMEASRPENAEAIRHLLQKTPFPVVGTYQAAGVIAREQLDCFIGRVGVFKNQPGDHVLDLADVVITIGYNPVEYEPELWNNGRNKTIIHLNYTPSSTHATYDPACELLGDVPTILHVLSQHLTPRRITLNKKITQLRDTLSATILSGKEHTGTPIHPLRFIYELSKSVTDETTICCDIGTVYLWMARYYLSHRPHQLLFSNGQQTLGVGLPWAMACHYARPGKPAISISGDGGFLFSAMELETAVREGIPFIHFIWRDGSYNMVKEQELIKYHRKSGVDLGRIHIPAFAEAFGAIGLELQDPNQFQTLFAEAMAAKKPVLIDVPIDYSDNPALFNLTDASGGH
jgi:acetolactate synthase-1/2/3 large subunit